MRHCVPEADRVELALVESVLRGCQPPEPNLQSQRATAGFCFFWPGYGATRSPTPFIPPPLWPPCPAGISRRFSASSPSTWRPNPRCPLDRAHVPRCRSSGSNGVHPHAARERDSGFRPGARSQAPCLRQRSERTPLARCLLPQAPGRRDDRQPSQTPDQQIRQAQSCPDSLLCATDFESLIFPDDMYYSHSFNVTHLSSYSFTHPADCARSRSKAG